MQLQKNVCANNYSRETNGFFSLCKSNKRTKQYRIIPRNRRRSLMINKRIGNCFALNHSDNNYYYYYPQVSACFFFRPTITSVIILPAHCPSHISADRKYSTDKSFSSNIISSRGNNYGVARDRCCHPDYFYVVARIPPRHPQVL